MGQVGGKVVWSKYKSTYMHWSVGGGQEGRGRDRADNKWNEEESKS